MSEYKETGIPKALAKQSFKEKMTTTKRARRLSDAVLKITRPNEVKTIFDMGPKERFKMLKVRLNKRLLHKLSNNSAVIYKHFLFLGSKPESPKQLDKIKQVK